MIRLLTTLALLIALLAPAPSRADPADIDAAARGVVRVVIMGREDDSVVPLSHGTGFAVSPRRIVTNAHVVRAAAMDDGLRIGVVPAEGDEAAYARILPLINYENRQCGLRATKTAMMEAGVIRSDAVRHPLEALHPATRVGLLELAREADVLALKWGK